MTPYDRSGVLALWAEKAVSRMYMARAPVKLHSIMGRRPSLSSMEAPATAAIMEKMGLMALMRSCVLVLVIPAASIICGCGWLALDPRD